MFKNTVLRREVLKRIEKTGLAERDPGVLSSPGQTNISKIEESLNTKKGESLAFEGLTDDLGPGPREYYRERDESDPENSEDKHLLIGDDVRVYRR